MWRRAALAAMVLVAVLAWAAPAMAVTPRPIVFAIVIDGLDGDRVDQGRAPFIASLLAGQGARSTYYRESRSVMIAETNPNHAAMMTGAHGGGSGIPGNAFAIYSPLADEDSCNPAGPRNLSALPTQTSGESATCLQAQTVFDAVKTQGDPDDLTTAAILGKPKLGRIFSGSRADYLWAPCASGADDDGYCADVPTNPVTGYAVDDRTVMDAVIGSFDGVGPRKRRPDFTFVNLPQVDSAGHAFGTIAPAYDAAIVQADEQIQRLVGALQDRDEWSRTVMVLLSDHSMDTTPGRTTLTSAFEDAGISGDDFLTVQNGSVDMVYVKRAGDQRFALLKRLRGVALAQSGVGEALYREPNPEDGGEAHTLGRVHPAWRVGGERTGDLLVTHDPGGAFSDPSSSSNPLPGNHGGPQTRDNFFAVIGGGDHVRLQDLAGNSDGYFDDTAANPRQAENVDVAPTVMGLLGLFSTRNNHGRFLGEAFDLRELPGRGAPGLRPKLRIKRLKAAKRKGTMRRRCPRVIRYRLSWTPKGGRYDLGARTRGKHRRLVRNRKLTSRVLKARPGQRYRFRLRMRSASGAGGPYTRRSLRVPRCR